MMQIAFEVHSSFRISSDEIIKEILSAEQRMNNGRLRFHLIVDSVSKEELLSMEAELVEKWKHL